MTKPILRSIGDIDREADAWGANCGPAAIAAALEVQLADVRDAVSPGGAFKGFMGANDLKAAIPRAGGRIVRTWSKPPQAPEAVFESAGDGRYVVLVRWLGPWDAVPRAAATKRHCVAFVYAPRSSPGWVFDINSGWLCFDEWHAEIVPLLIPKRGSGEYVIDWMAQV